MEKKMLNVAWLNGATPIGKGVGASSGGSSGGGGNVEIPQDGKTRLYISIAAEGRMDFPLNFTQSMSQGVTVDWGDGSSPQTYSGNTVHAVHKYDSIGDYVIVLDVADGCELGLGDIDNGYGLIGNLDIASDHVYRNMLKKALLGDSVTSIGEFTFNGCYSLSSITIPNSVTSIEECAFYECTSLSSITIPNSVTSIGDGVFERCYSLPSITIPNGITSIGSGAFYKCYSLSSITIPNSVTSIGYETFVQCNVAIYDFSKHTSVPTLGPGSFDENAEDFSIVVPDNLYSQWVSATNWSDYAGHVVRKSDFDNGNSIPDA